MTLRIRPVFLAGTIVCLLVIWSLAPPTYGQMSEVARGRVNLATGSIAERRAWSSRIDRMLRTGELRIRQVREDTLVPGRTHERADQYYRGIRVFGADIARQLRSGVTESLFGTIHQGISIDTAPTLDEDRARALLASRTGQPIDDATPAELVILPLDAGRYALTWRMRVVTRGDSRQYFLDAHTGATVLDYSDR